MRIRQHRGSLFDSMETVETIEPTREAIAAWAELVYDIKCPASQIVVKPDHFDIRVHWNNHLVTLSGFGVLGYCDQEVLL